MVPDHGGGAEAQRRATFLQPPARVHVVTRSTELRIEPADRLETGFAERHVASGDMLGLAVGQQDVNGPARRTRDALGDGSIARRGEVRSTHRGVRRAQEPSGEVGEPVRIGVGIVVEIGDDFAGGCIQARVARTGEATVLGPDQPAVVVACDGSGLVRRSVIHHDNLVIGIRESPQSFEAVKNGACTVVRAHDHRDPGPREARCEGHVGERLLDDLEGGLGRTIGAREAECPVLHVMAMPVPLVGPREHEHAGASSRERRPHLPVERLRLHVVAIAETVESQFAHDERSVTGDILQTPQVRLEPRRGLEVDVEAHEIEERELEVFRRGVVDVGHEPVRVLVLDHPAKPLEVALDLWATQPARHRRRDLIAEGIAQERRVTGTLADSLADQRLDLGHLLLAIDEEAHILFGGQSHHDPESVPLGHVEQGARRGRVRNADGVDPVRGHLGEVALNDVQVVVLVAARIGAKRPIGHAANVEFFVADEDEFAADDRPGEHRSGDRRARAANLRGDHLSDRGTGRR